MAMLHDRTEAFRRMMGEGTLQPSGDIVIQEGQMKEAEAIEDMARLVKMGYATVLEGGAICVRWNSAAEAVVKKGRRLLKEAPKDDLWDAVRSERFEGLIHDATEAGNFIRYKPEAEDAYCLRLPQARIHAWHCVAEVARLIRRGLAYMEESEPGSVFLRVDYRDILEEEASINSNLSTFRRLLGAPNSVKRMILAIEEGQVSDGCCVVDLTSPHGKQVVLEAMAMVDAGVATAGQDGRSISFSLGVANWLLEQVAAATDRISFQALYQNTL